MNPIWQGFAPVRSHVIPNVFRTRSCQKIPRKLGGEVHQSFPMPPLHAPRLRRIRLYDSLWIGFRLKPRTLFLPLPLPLPSLSPAPPALCLPLLLPLLIPSPVTYAMGNSYLAALRHALASIRDAGLLRKLASATRRAGP